MTVERDGLDFTFSWKVMDENHGGGQWCKFRTSVLPKDKYLYTDITTSDTSVTIPLYQTSYYPLNPKNILKSVTAMIKGKRATEVDGDVTTTYGESDWVYKVFFVRPPRAPVVEQELQNVYPVCEYSWSVETDDTDARPFCDVEWQTLRTQKSNETNPEKLYWGRTSKNDWGTSANHGSNMVVTGGTSAEGTVTITEDSGDLDKGSWTRWVRFRSRGPGGPSPWSYIRHVYAVPAPAIIDRNASKTFARNGAGDTIKARVEWTAAWTSSNPIDYSVVQYAKDVPAAAQAVPAGISWQDALTVADSRGTDAAEIVVNGQLEEDECLWVQVVTHHDVYDTYSTPALVQRGELAAPAFDGDVSLDYAQNTATISVDRNSDVPDSRCAVYFHRNDDPAFICAILAPGEDSRARIPLNYITTSDRLSFSLMEFQGSYKGQSRSYTIGSTTYTYYRYTISPNMTSDKVEKGGEVPVAPTGVTATYSYDKVNGAADVLVDWNWSWYNATHAEISWSDKKNAWESTNPPSTYEVDRMHDSQIYVNGLEMGKRWYFRVRLIRETSDATIYGPYGKTASVLIAEIPDAPGADAAEPSTVTEPEAMAGVSRSVTDQNQYVRLNWSYSNTDGTAQRYAEIREVTIEWDDTLNEDVITEVAMRGKVYKPHRLIFRPADFTDPKWTHGTTHYLQVRVTSTAGLQSEWSNPVAITVARKPTCTISASSLTTVDGKYQLTALPLSVTVTGAADGDTTTLVIERNYDYNIIRPDETDFHGCEGETIVSTSITGEGTFSIGLDDLIGTLDDKAYYRLIATVEDSFGQTAQQKIPFRVMWDYQPTKPTATVTVSDGQALITPACASTGTGDYFDIYRRSADRPELIVSGGQWGQTYRDPYPTIGTFGGYRVVSRSLYGDYFDANSRVTWTDVPALFESGFTIIDFGRYRLELEYDLDLSSSWEKDVTVTTYLGGSVQGDWNPAVQRKTTVNTIAVGVEDTERIRNLRRLAVYTGICHIRTPEGSSFAADIQVSEAMKNSKLAEFTLSITRLDPQELDGELVEEG